MKTFDKQKVVRYVQSGSLLKLKHYLNKCNKKDICFNLNFKNGSLDQTLLHIASSFGDDAIIRCLIKHGARVNIKDKNGNSPVHVAAKYILDTNEYASYKLLINPLIQKFPGGLNIKNKDGKTAECFLSEARQTHKLLNSKKQQIESSESDENKSQDENESKTWEEKISDELFYENGDDSTKFPDGDWTDSKYSTFQQWADEIANEYERKNRFKNMDKVSHKMTKRQKWMEQEEEKLRQYKAENLYMNAINQRKTENLEKMHHKYQEGIQQLKEKSLDPTKKLKFRDIPWPCRGSVNEMVEVMMSALSSSATIKERKKFVVRQLVLWHPDKFQQMCASQLADEDKDVILDTVKLLSQSLTELLKSETIELKHTL